MLILCTVVLLAAYAFILLAKCCEQTRVYSYKELGVRAFGVDAGSLIQWVVLLYTFGSCVGYVVLIGESLSPFTVHRHRHPTHTRSDHDHPPARLPPPPPQAILCPA